MTNTGAHFISLTSVVEKVLWGTKRREEIGRCLHAAVDPATCVNVTARCRDAQSITANKELAIKGQSLASRDEYL
jgi:hypothetical protein